MVGVDHWGCIKAHFGNHGDSLCAYQQKYYLMILFVIPYSHLPARHNKYHRYAVSVKYFGISTHPEFKYQHLNFYHLDVWSTRAAALVPNTHILETGSQGE